MTRQRLLLMVGICSGLGAVSCAAEPPAGEATRTGALALGGDGHVTNVCGYSLPLPYGFTGTSGPGCEGACASGWVDGHCTDPWDSGSRVEVYGCPQKTFGGACDGNTNGGTLIASFSAGEQVSISDFWDDPAHCTFQLDVLRPHGGDPIGLRDFLIWERDDCSPPPSCRSHDGDLVACNADPQDCAYYSCSESCWPEGTPMEVACPECDCPGGTDYLGNPVHATSCGERVCGEDYHWYSCGLGGWVFEGGDCPTPCSAHDGDLVACNADPQDCAYYSCSESCWPEGTSIEVACPTSSCTTPTPGLVITEDTTLCPGTYWMAILPGSAAIHVAASGITLTCDGTVIEGTGGFATTEDPNVGIRIEQQSDVTVVGCTVRSFRYGVVAKDAWNVTLSGLHLDDNFTDPSAGWTQDSVQGGGVRFEGVTGGSITGSTLARNWNAVELRGTSGVTVSDNVADHCSNTGATLVDAHGNLITQNDFSWAIRGDGLSFPSAWYGVDTRDSAGIIVDAGSSGNVVSANDLTFGGDGIFVRSIIGACAEDNWFTGNDTSYSPHNAIECWCDGNQFIDNIASHSHFGVWLGGTDRGVVRGNTIDGNLVDGISIQIGEDRHALIEGNAITNSGRVGLLLTGRQYQAWHDLSHWDPSLANSSHILVQGNTFSGNAVHDVFTTSTRSLVLASNCGVASQHLGPETEIVASVGGCGLGVGRPSPSAELSDPGPITQGVPVQLDASASAPGVAGDPLSFTWLVQASGARFPSGALPPLVLGVPSGGATQWVTLTAPGFYDIDVTAHDGHLGALASRSVAVIPAGLRLGDAASDWTYDCVSYPQCATAFADDAGGVEGTSVRVTTDAPFEFVMSTPATRDLGLDASGYTRLGLFVRASNGNDGGWQGSYPVIVLGGSTGERRYEPQVNLLPTQATEWIYLDVPLGGGDGWDLVSSSGSLVDMDWLEIHTDTWGGDPVDVWVDAITLY